MTCASIFEADKIGKFRCWMARAEEAADLIAYRAPILERLYLHDEDEYSIEVVEAFKYQTGNMFKY